MNVIQWLFGKGRDFLEILLPCVAFSALFVAFIWQLVSRYIIGVPITWSNEVQVTGYAWTVILSACYVRRVDGHVRFAVLYDLLSPRGQRIMRVFGNSLLIVAFAILLPYTIDYVVSDRVITPVFRVPRSIIFSPMILFVFSIMMYTVFDVYHDVLDIVRRNPPRDPRAKIQAETAGEESAQ